jgi:hypothetical protein
MVEQYLLFHWVNKETQKDTALLLEEKNDVNIQQPLCCHAHAYNTRFKQNGPINRPSGLCLAGTRCVLPDMTIDKWPGYHFMTSIVSDTTHLL